MKLLLEMQQEIKQQKSEMMEMQEDIKNTINNNINEKFKNLEIKNEILEEKIETQKMAINNLERHIRRKNLIIFGVEEGEKSYHELEKNIVNIINTHFNLQYDKTYIESVRRLGKKSVKVRPVIITFTTLGFKLNIQKNSKCLEKTPYYVKQDYPLEILNKRKALQIELKKEQDLGKTAFIKYDKLIVLDNKEKHIPTSQTNKRNLSESPESTANGRQNTEWTTKKQQPSKKNKTADLKNFVIQKPKLVYNRENNPQEKSNNKQADTE